ncbi:MAG: PHP domain-containing protein [Chloroflexi bacterium]|nr:PHP domain-containing protein [Chloroflexota bacterium]
MLKADLHVHTRYSFDSTMELQSIIDRCTGLGISCVSVNDHGTIEGALKLRELAPFKVIVGQEILTTEGEVMGLFLQQAVPKGLSPVRTAEMVKEQGGLFGLPHPFDKIGRWGLPKSTIHRLAPLIDVIEVFNSRTLFFWDSAKTRLFAQQHHIPASGGSDAHVPWEVGRAYVEMPDFNGPKEFIEALAEGHIVGRYTWPWPHLMGLWTRLKRRFFC